MAASPTVLAEDHSANSNNSSNHVKNLQEAARELRGSIPFHPADQNKGKTPKFRGSDATSLLIDLGRCSNSTEAREIIDDMQKNGVITPSKGSEKSPKGVEGKRFRFDDVGTHVSTRSESNTTADENSRRKLKTEEEGVPINGSGGGVSAAAAAGGNDSARKR